MTDASIFAPPPPGREHPEQQRCKPAAPLGSQATKRVTLPQRVHALFASAWVSLSQPGCRRFSPLSLGRLGLGCRAAIRKIQVLLRPRQPRSLPRR